MPLTPRNRRHIQDEEPVPGQQGDDEDAKEEGDGDDELFPMLQGAFQPEAGGDNDDDSETQRSMSVAIYFVS